MPSFLVRMPDSTFRYVILIASLLMLFFGTGSVFLIVVALKPIATDFNWPRAVPSFAYSLQFICGGIGGVGMGYWLDRSGMSGPALIGSLSIALGSILMKYVTEIWELYTLFGLLMGLTGRSTMFAPLMSNITRWFIKSRSMAVGVVGAGQSLAGAVWPPIFQASNESIGWRDTTMYYGLFTLCMMTPLALLFRRSPGESIEGPPGAVAIPNEGISSDVILKSEDAGTPFTSRQIQVWLSIASTGCCISMALPLAHLVAHVSDLGYPAARGAEALSLMLICASASCFFGVGYLGGRYGGLRTLLIFSSIQTVVLVVMPFVDDLTFIYFVAALFGLGYGGVLPSYPVIVREFLPARSAGQRTATIILFAGTGMGIGAWMGGALYDLTGSYNMAFFLGAAFNAVNLVIISSLIRLHRVGRMTLLSVAI
jgi:MFS family permease